MLYSAAEQVYREVKESILSGDLPGGELISEGDIARRMELSRTPVREAFLRLEAEGWMRLYPKRGALVVPIADGEAENVVDARQMVETQSLRNIVDRPGALSALDAALRANLTDQHQIAERRDVAAFSAADADFHRLIVKAAGNPILDNFYSSLRERQRRMTARSLARDPSQLPRIIEDHSLLADLVAARDVDGFAAALLTHMHEVHGLERRGGTR
ncbi:GntR family transcriptional regulator [Rhodococcus sp. NPDC058521]|uniref:GntR family transcriptional regulator n=1 Tax=Rhodococcus sp. NPDC058521 TaxID=3346536 RepID=UPI00365987F0